MRRQCYRIATCPPLRLRAEGAIEEVRSSHTLACSPPLPQATGSRCRTRRQPTTSVVACRYSSTSSWPRTTSGTAVAHHLCRGRRARGPFTEATAPSRPRAPHRTAAHMGSRSAPTLSLQPPSAAAHRASRPALRPTPRGSHPTPTPPLLITPLSHIVAPRRPSFAGEGRGRQIQWRDSRIHPRPAGSTPSLLRCATRSWAPCAIPPWSARPAPARLPHHRLPCRPLDFWRPVRVTAREGEKAVGTKR